MLNTDLEPIVLEFTAAAYSIDGAGVVVAEAETGGRDLLSLNIDNTGDNSITSCVISKKFSPAGDWHPFFGGTDFESTTNDNIEFITEATPHDLAAAGTATFQIWVSGAYAVKVEIASTSGTGAVVSGNLSVG